MSFVDELFVRGISFGFMAGRGHYRSAAEQREIENICNLGVNYSVDAFEIVIRETDIPSFFAGCCSRSYDGESQANYLTGVVRAFSSRPWWKGLMWWKWDEQQKRPHYTQPHGDTGFTIHDKPAAQVMRRWCAGEEL